MREKWLVMDSRLGPHPIRRGIGPGLHVSTDLTPVGERSVREGSTLHPASDHLPPRWAGLSRLCPQPPRHPPTLPQGGGRPTLCLPSWGLQGPQGPLLCPQPHPLPFLPEPHPSGTEEKCVLTGSPSLPEAPSFPGGPGGPGGPCGPGTARAWGLCTTGPARPWEGERARLEGHTHADLPTPPLLCPGNTGWNTGWTHRGHTCTGFGRVAPQGPAQLSPLPAHMLPMLWPEPPGRAHRVPGVGTQRKGSGHQWGDLRDRLRWAPWV